MIWIVAVVIIVVAIFFIMRGKSAPAQALSVRHSVRSAQSHMAALPAEQQAELASEIRSTALHRYDAIAAAARKAGKDVGFAH